jgi:Leucine-rich repeat (LRR) protein
MTWKELSILVLLLHFTTSWYYSFVASPLLLYVSAATTTTTTAATATTITRPSTQEILEEFYDATNGDQWKMNKNWKSTTTTTATTTTTTTNGNDANVCTWYGIYCNDQGDITRIELDRNNLSGSIPINFWKLTKLSAVNFRSNLLTDVSLDGLFTDNFENDPRAPIELLILSENQLSSISGIGHLTETLQYLNLNKNHIDQALPMDVFDLTNLRTLYIAYNQLTGTLSTLIGKLTKLTEFYAFRNHLTGQLPSQLGQLDKCQILGIGNNLWSGTLPTELNNMVNLRDLSIHNNNPTTTATTTDASAVVIENNEHQESSSSSSTQQQMIGITGPILSFENMPFLSTLYLDGNHLSGTIPPDFLRHNNNTDNNQHVSVGLKNNHLTGAIPKALERFEKLNLDLVGNSIDDIPPELCEKGGWMGGLVEEYGCNAILCPIGTYSIDGRETAAESACVPCQDGFPYLGATSCSTDPTNQQPWEILAAFYLAMGGDKWDQKDGWEVFDNLFNGETLEELEMVNITICTAWYGILCQDGLPTRLSLPDNSLFGDIPSIIFDLSWTVFDLSNNNVQMEDLTIIRHPESLTSLIMSNIKIQSLEGIEKLTQLEQLYLDGLDIRDGLPTFLFDLTRLKTLHLQHGHFTGLLSTNIGKLQKLER